MPLSGTVTLSGTSPKRTDATGKAVFDDLVIDEQGSYILEAPSGPSSTA